MDLEFDELESFENESYRGLFEFGDASATPGKVPLLIETPTGDRRQVEVSVDATVGDLKSLVNSFSDFEANSEGGESGFDLVFGNNSLGGKYELRKMEGRSSRIEPIDGCFRACGREQYSGTAALSLRVGTRPTNCC